MFSILNYTFFS